MKTYRFILSTIIGIAFFSSCTVSHVNENLILGKWKNGKLKSFIVDKKFAGDTAYTTSNKLRLGLDSANLLANEKASLLEFKQSTRTERDVKPTGGPPNIKTEMTFKKDKTVSILLKKGSIEGTWKMNGKGNKVIIMESATKKKSTINIANIDLANLVIYEKYPAGKLTIVYSK
jgi:hypothetical protein